MSSDQKCDAPAGQGQGDGGVSDSGKITHDASCGKRAPAFVKLNRGTETVELLRHPAAFLLLTQIALRARRTVGGFNPHCLQPGEALVGDYRALGLTEQRYRTAKRTLRGWGLATFRPTNKGTIATLASLAVYDINGVAANDPGSRQATSRPTGKQRTDNDYQEAQEGTRIDQMCEDIYQAYPRHVGRKPAKAAIKKVLSSGQRTPEQLLADVTEYAAAQRGHPDSSKLPHPATWINQARWQDDRSEWSAWQAPGRSGGNGTTTPSGPASGLAIGQQHHEDGEPVWDRGASS